MPCSSAPSIALEVNWHVSLVHAGIELNYSDMVAHRLKSIVIATPVASLCGHPARSQCQEIHSAVTPPN